jgi:hypothetical protein
MINSTIKRIIALILAFSMLVEVFLPTTAFALTTGPSQPEVQSFEPAGTSDMVDLFTGDFNYNIPLLTVGDYPINISYHSGIGMDQEASWVGLGWNINPGVVNRNVRGIPDDFDGDLVKKELYTKPNRTYGLTAGGSLELVGANKVPGASISGSLTVRYNNYRGMAFALGLRPSLSVFQESKGNLTVGLGISLDSQDGLGINPSLSFSYEVSEKQKSDDPTTAASIGLGASFNSRGGLKQIGLSTGISTTSKYKEAAKKANGEVKKNAKGETIYKEGRITSGNSFNGSVITFGSPVSLQTSDFPQNSFGLNLRVTAGGAVFFLHPGAFVSGFYSSQNLARTSEDISAYGYLAAHNGRTSSLSDFTREKDGAYTKHKPNLPVTNFSYDMFSVTGQGIGGMYRLHRSDVGILHDREISGVSSGGGLGAEIGGGWLAHFGGDITANYSVTTTGKWTRNNLASRNLDFVSSVGTAEQRYTYEPAYFKQSGEMSVQSPLEDFYNRVGSDDPVRLELSGSTGVSNSFSIHQKIEPLTTKANPQVAVSNLPINSPIFRKTRDKRNQVITYLSASEAMRFAMDTSIVYFDTLGQRKTLSRLSSIRKPHHISEMTVLRPDGMRYIYGIPAYNIYQVEATFNVQNKINTITTDGLVSYEPLTNDIVENGIGVDHYYSATHTPGFAHSYLLTDIVSPDYVDMTGNGLSNDDLGSFTKINYSLISDNYNWRTPYQSNKAYHNEGLKYSTQDDKGSYVFGTKEIWHVYSIETKNHIAIFKTSSRLDGRGVIGKSGGLSPLTNNSSRKLDKIILYAKLDYEKNGVNAIPIQTVHFEYDYSLCKGIPNTIGSANNTGKLTLRKIFFTYGTSHKARLNAYVFNYSSVNPNYKMKSVDRWGNYMPEGLTAMSNADYPYTYQNADSTAKWAEAWHLKQIRLPSGGRIDIQYESDDYAYVQDQKAAQMFVVAGVGTGPNYNTRSTSKLMDAFGSGQAQGVTANRRYIFFRRDLSLPLPSSPSEYRAHVRRNYISEDVIYFKFLVQLTGNNSSSKEYVPGYADVEEVGIAADNSDYAYVRLKAEQTSYGLGIHPITKSAWAFARLYAPATVFPGYDTSDDPFKAITGLVGKGGVLDEVISGIDRMFFNQRHGTSFDANRSFIRLKNPLGKKLGGGSRVRQITMSDNWDQMINGSGTVANATYGQVYDYTVFDPTQGGNISSGVAAYEPLLGGDEIACRRPIVYTESKKWVPSQEHYMETPLGESFYPSPTVGYSRVTVKSYIPSEYNVTRTGTGHTVHEFYTAKDFPVVVQDTPIQLKEGPSARIGNMFGIDARTELAVSQGYKIELNDMHGKPKAETKFAHNRTEPFSVVQYVYNTKSNNSRRLSSSVSVILPNGTISLADVGKEVDFVTDMREQVTNAYNAGVSAQVDVTMIPLPFFPLTIPLPSVWPSFGSEHTSFRSVVTTKVVQRYGILVKTIAKQEGSSVITENLGWDSESGDVLLTRVQNEHNDWIYNLQYPSHWAYSGMGPAYQNIGMRIANVVVSTSSLGMSDMLLPDAISYNLLEPGDELSLTDSLGTTVTHAWVTSLNKYSQKVRIQKKNGSAVSPGIYSLKVIRSGHRNMHNLPIASISSLRDPRIGDQLVIDKELRVLQASASEFSDEWQSFCGGKSCEDDCLQNGDLVNYYATGLKGNWRQKRAYTYVSDRQQSNPVDVRNDGFFTNFRPFWKKPVSGISWAPERSDFAWTWKQEVVKYSPFGNGMELENKDPLGRFTAAVYGYNNTLPVIIGQNARYNEIGFQGFEDHTFEDSLALGSCSLLPHFSPSKSTNCFTISDKVAHTGQSSLRINHTCKNVSLYRTVRPIPSSSRAHALSYSNMPLVRAILHCIESMFLEPGKRYTLESWLRMDKITFTGDREYPWEYLDEYSGYMEVVFLGSCDSLGSIILSPAGNKIEGWQRIHGDFIVPTILNGQVVEGIRIDLVGTDASDFSITEGISVNSTPYRIVSFFDDLRIFPFDAQVKSYVYDQTTLRLKAELDNNNYATFYEYDQEGNLVRIKRETERGVYTVKENRQSLPKFTPR